jgi:APA family basic amino acid/polyamine antiporter
MEPEPLARESGQPGYRRELSLADVTLLVVGCIIGAGIFFTPQGVAASAASDGAILAVWGLGGLAALAGALVLAELAALFPRAGGMYVFLRATYGPLPAFLQGWAITLIIAPGALAVVATVFASHLLELLPALRPLRAEGLASAVLVLLTLVNVAGVRWGSATQGVFSLGKLGALLLLIGAGLAFPGPRAAAPERPEMSLGPGGAAGLAAALVPILFTYGGWQNATFVAGEVRRPQRTVPLAMLIGTLIVIAVYVLVNAAYLRVLEPAAIAGEKLFASRAAELALGPRGALLVRVGILLSTFGFCAAALLANPRVTQAMSADGAFLRPFAALHPRYRTPHVAILATGAWSLALLWAADPGELLNSIVFADALFFALCGAAVPILRRRMPDAPRAYRCPLHPWVPLAFAAVEIVVLAASIAGAGARSNLLGAGVLAAGALAYALGPGAARSRAAR